eukprot:GFKZ01006677.1.p1 GENE.GFKZ01006677.1~~GFKZ01006677.1.p1  ORF type:complete len:599 (-),score=59.73 GFKZ01006677.1:1581-3377(-)
MKSLANGTRSKRALPTFAAPVHLFQPRSSRILHFPSQRHYQTCNPVTLTFYPKHARRRLLRASLDHIPVPSDIIELDERERQRRASLSSSPPPRLTSEQKRKLFKNAPHLYELDRALNEALARDDCNPEDSRVYSWVYRKLRSQRPSPWSRLIIAAAACCFVRNTFLRLGIRGLVIFTLQMEKFMGLLAFITGTAALALAVRDKEDGDARIRGLAMCGLSALWLLPIAMVASVGHGTAAAVIGVLVRVGPIALALWYWRDLRWEVANQDGLGWRMYRIWRWIVTVGLIAFGALARVVGLGLKDVAIGDYLGRGAAEARSFLGRQFPVAMSLCNDPRGLFLLACLGLGIGVAYLVYWVVYVVEFFAERDHRDCFSALTTTLLRWKWYSPNETELDKFGRMSGGEDSLLPSPVMMLRKCEDDITTDSSLLSTESTMPIFSLLDKEEEIMKNEGIDRWVKPRGEDVPLADGLTYEERSLHALVNWARFPSEDEQQKSFAEFFDTVEDDEYQYDPESGNWVFSDKEVDERATRALMDKISAASEESEFSISDLEKFVKEVGDFDLLDLASDPEMDPELRREILKHHGATGDDTDDPPYTVTV